MIAFINKTYRALLPVLLLGALATIAAIQMTTPFQVHAQNRTSFGGIRNAITYDYGTPASAAPPITVAIGILAPGTTSVTMLVGYTVLADGTPLYPFATNAPINIGAGSNVETVRPTAVSCSTPTVPNTCVITGWFHNAHGVGDPVTSGTYGLMEAVNAAHTQGGLVAVDGPWTAAGGTTTTITGDSHGSGLGWTNVSVLDWRGTTGAKSYTSSANGLLMAATAVSLY